MSAEATKSTDSADLFLERDDVVGREAQLEQALRSMPGVASVRIVQPPGETAEAGVRVEFDAAVTNPVILRQALAKQGFAVLSAAEHPERVAARERPGSPSV